MEIITNWIFWVIAGIVILLLKVADELLDIYKSRKVSKPYGYNELFDIITNHKKHCPYRILATYAASKNWKLEIDKGTGNFRYIWIGTSQYPAELATFIIKNYE